MAPTLDDVARSTATHPVEDIAAGASSAVLTGARVPPVTACPSYLVARETA